MSLPLGTLRLSIITLLGSRCKAQGRIRGHTAGCSEVVGQGRGGVQESYRVGELLGESGALNIAFCWIFFESPKALGRLSLQGIQAPPLSAPLQHFQPSFHLSIPSPPPSTAAWELLSPGAKLRLKDQPWAGAMMALPQGLSSLACLKFTFVPWEVMSYSLVASGWEWSGRERVICADLLGSLWLPDN